MSPEPDLSREMTRTVRKGVVVLLLAAGALSAWAALAPLSGAVIAPGFVKVDLNRKVVQHQEGGIVQQVHVRDGDRVAAGDVLLTLQDVEVNASVEVLTLQLEAERAKAARLEAEAAYRDAVRFPRSVADHANDPRIAELLQRERALFRSRRDAVEQRIAGLRKQTRDVAEEAAALTGQIAAAEKAVALQREELKANEDLLRQHYVQRTRVLALQRAVADYEASIGEQRAELAKAKQRASELELRIVAVQADYKQSAIDELKAATSRLFDLEERMRPSRDAQKRQRVTAPVAGEIVGLRVFNPGAVVAPREVLLEIVPEDRELVIEAQLRPEDINHVKAGAPADVRLTAYKYRNTPLVGGAVAYVSGDRLQDPHTGKAYYLLTVKISNEALNQAGNLRLQAGMPAEIYVRTDERTTFDYLVAPLTAYLRRAMREPL